jgi:nitroreductase
MNETLKVLRERRSTRKFKSEQISSSELQAILEGGLYAPSGGNDQSWNFTVIQNAELLEELNVQSKEALKSHPNEIVQKMAINDKYNVFYEAPTVIIVSGRETAIAPELDCAAAAENMLIAAESIDIGACWITFVGFLFNSEKGAKYKEKLTIPEGYTPYYAVVLGYKAVNLTNAAERKENTVQYIK